MPGPLAAIWAVFAAGARENGGGHVLRPLQAHCGAVRGNVGHYAANARCAVGAVVVKGASENGCSAEGDSV